MSKSDIIWTVILVVICYVTYYSLGKVADKLFDWVINDKSIRKISSWFN